EWAEEREAGGPLSHRRGNGEDQQRRGPLREDDVLQQVRPEERVVRQWLELGEERGEDERDAERSRGNPQARNRAAAGCESESGRERRRKGDRLRRGMHLATVPSVSAGVAQW